MAAVGIAEAAGCVVVLRKEECSERSVGGIGTEKLVHGAQEAHGLIERDGALAANVGLQVRHQQGRGDTFPGNVTDHEAEMIVVELDKIVVIPADVSSRQTDSGKFQS